MDVIQLNAQDYNPDIDGEPDPVTDAQLLHAESIREDTLTGISESKDHTTIPSTTNGSEHQPSEVLSDIHANEHNNVEQQ